MATVAAQRGHAVREAGRSRGVGHGDQDLVDAVLRVYDKYLEEDDLVGYYGLGDKCSENGDGWIFEMTRKGDKSDELRGKVAGSVEKRGDPHVYSSIEKCVSVSYTHLTLPTKA